MPKRSSLRERLDAEARGQEAVYGQPSTVDRQPSTPAGQAAGVPWEVAHQRVTFYCPRDLLGQVEAEMGRSGRSKSRIITDALREHLGGPVAAAG